MGYSLRAHISTGRIDSDTLGSFEIRDGELEAEDYATALSLVERYNVEWPDGDPGPDEAEVEAAVEAEDEAEAEVVDESLPEPRGFDASEFVDRTPMGVVIDDLETGDYDAHLDAIESEASRRGVLAAVDARREAREE